MCFDFCDVRATPPVLNCLQQYTAKNGKVKRKTPNPGKENPGRPKTAGAEDADEPRVAPDQAFRAF